MYLTNVKHIALFGATRQDDRLPKIAHLLSLLCATGMTAVCESNFCAYLSSKGILPAGIQPADQLPADTDVIVSIGGDGTFLRAAQWSGATQIPILGVNSGHLGFLANCSIDDTDDLVRQLADGKLLLEARTLLRLDSPDMPPDIWPYALNEIAITKEDTSSMISIQTSVDGHFLADYLGDGLIISTPTGSTAYNMSLGGPILQPTLGCVALTPIASHSLTLRPLVVSADATIECTTRSRARDYRISVDGQSFVVRRGGTLRITRAPFHVVTLRVPDDNFAATLRRKLLWGSR